MAKPNNKKEIEDLMKAVTDNRAHLQEILRKVEDLDAEIQISKNLESNAKISREKKESKFGRHRDGLEVAARLISGNPPG